MKLGTRKSDRRDGQLVVVAKNLSRCVPVPDIAPTLQTALENWSDAAPELAAVYRLLNAGRIPDAERFEPAAMASPLPRAYQWADGSAYVNHVELVRKARGAELPADFWSNPLMYQGGSDGFLGPTDDIVAVSGDHGVDFESEIAVITDDVPMAIDADVAAGHIKLIMLANDISLRNLIPAELAKGFGFFQSKPASSFSPVAVTPNELGSAWDGRKVELPLKSYLNGDLFGQPNAGEDMTFDFPTLIAHAAATRNLSAGTIIGSGTVSNVDRSVGSSCIAERRMLEQIEFGAPRTPFMSIGDVVRIEMVDGSGNSIFGTIEQRVVMLGHGPSSKGDESGVTRA